MNCGFWTYDGKFLIAAPQEWGNIGDELIFGFDKTGDGQVDYEETFYIGDREADNQSLYQKEGKLQLNFLVKESYVNNDSTKIEYAEQMREYIDRTLQFPIYDDTILSIENTGENILTGERKRRIYYTL